MGFGFARRRRDEMERITGGGHPPPVVDPAPGIDFLARFAYVEADGDEDFALQHDHDGPCHCGLRGE